MPEDNNTTPELNLEEIVETAPEELSDGQKAFLEENKDNLTDEQAAKFGIEKEQEEEQVNLDEIVPETRTEIEKQKERIRKEEEEIDPDDEATISRVLEKKVGPLEKELRATKDQIEVDAFIRDNPEYAKYRGVALKYMANPAYSNIPAHNIMAIVASKDLQKLGAQKEREAAENAKKTRGGGSSFRKPGGGGIDWSKASAEEVAAKKAEILGRK